MDNSLTLYEALREIAELAPYKDERTRNGVREALERAKDDIDTIEHLATMRSTLYQDLYSALRELGEEPAQDQDQDQDQAPAKKAARPRRR